MAAMCLLGILATSVSAQAGLKVGASLDRNQMSTDDRAVLTIVVSGDQQTRIDLPEVDGLTLQPVGNSSSMKVINGQVSVTVEQRVIVHASKVGEYVIPPIRALSTSGITHSDSPLKLSVSKGSGRSHSKGHGSAVAPSMPNTTLGQKVDGSSDANGLAFLEVIPAKSDVVVGEFVPVEIQAYFRAGERLTLKSLPQIEGGGFVLKNQEGKPKQEVVEKNGIPYTRLTFYAGLSAIKPGEFPVKVSLDATVVVREKSRSNQMNSLRSRMGSIFNDPFFGSGMLDDFFGRMVEREVALKTDPISVKVGELPQEGKPAGFSGAVGKFTVISSATESSVKTGDPVTVEVAVTGEGNFSRVPMPNLSDKNHWKVYPSSKEFAPADAIGQAGAKVFKQVIVPLSPEVTEVPSFELSFYNPETKAYETTRSEAVPISVNGAAISASSLASQSAGAKTDPSEGDHSESANQLEEISKTDIAPSPLYARPWFFSLQVMTLTFILLAIAIRVTLKVTRDPGRVAKQSLLRALKKSSDEMDRAIARNDVAAFFVSLKQMLQTYTGCKLGLEPTAVTSADVSDTEIRELLDVADRVAFSGQWIDPTELNAWKERALSIIGAPVSVIAK